MKLIRDDFDLARYLQQNKDDYKLSSPARMADSVVDMFYGEKVDHGDPLPWAKTHKLIKLRPGEVTVWCGINGHGKSMVTSQVALHLAWSGSRPCMASMEMLPRRTLWRMVRQASGYSEPSISYIRRFLGWMDRKMYIFDHVGTVEPELILGSIRFAAVERKVDHFFIDSLMKCSRGEDDYNGQKDFVDQLTAIAKDHNIHIHLIHHVRKGENEFTIPGKFDGKGSGAIADLTDNWITVWRNKRKEATLASDPTNAKAMNEPDCILNVDKQRNGEWEGRIGLWFDHASMSYKETSHEAPRRYELELEEVCVADKPDVAGGEAGALPETAERAAAAG